MKPFLLTVRLSMSSVERSEENHESMSLCKMSFSKCSKIVCLFCWIVRPLEDIGIIQKSSLRHSACESKLTDQKPVCESLTSWQQDPPFHQFLFSARPFCTKWKYEVFISRQGPDCGQVKLAWAFTCSTIFPPTSPPNWIDSVDDGGWKAYFLAPYSQRFRVQNTQVVVTFSPLLRSRFWKLNLDVASTLDSTICKG